MKSNQKFENPFGNIFEKAYAQDADLIVSPTLPVDPNLQGPLFGTGPDITGTPTTPSSGLATIKLTSDEASDLQMNDSFTLKVEILSNDLNISGFGVTIVFNPNKLEILNTKYLDTYFTNNNEINADEFNGTISIKGDALEDAITINRAIAEIEFAVRSEGLIDINVDEDSEATFLNSETGENIPLNFLNFETQVGVSEVTSTSTTMISPTQTTTSTYKVIPKSDIESISEIWPLFVGGLVLVIGLWMKKASQKDEDIF
ncbi:hypothetical protein GF362_07195 [Candidatus Dojkabacteria bacterium]|nr:hypothetical protein [Candidatus Dojkabacteria bacterium]